MNQDFFSDNNKNLLHNLVKNKILELDNINIDNYPELNQNLETTLISVFRQGKYPNIVEFNKRVLQECIPTLRRLVNTGKKSTPKSSTDTFNMDALINDINQSGCEQVNQSGPPINNNNNIQDQQILNNIKSSGDDEMRNMYQRSVDMRTPSKEKPVDIDFSKSTEDFSHLDMDQEYEKKMKERNSLPAYHEPPKNPNNTVSGPGPVPEGSVSPENDIDKLLENLQKNSPLVNKKSGEKIQTEIQPSVKPIGKPIRENITQHITVNSSGRYNLISSRYNYKIKLDKFLDAPKSVKSIELLRLFIPIDTETIFDYPILNIKIPELDNIIFKMSKVSEIETNQRKYAVYNPVINRGYFPVPSKPIEDLNLLNIRFYDFFNYPILNDKVSPDIIKIKNIEFNTDNTKITLQGQYPEIQVGNSVQIKQILKDNASNPMRFTFNNIVHKIEEIEEVNPDKPETKITINYPKVLLKGLKVKDINQIKKNMNMYLIILNLQQELLFKVSFNKMI